MTKEEIKKAIYKQKPLAALQHIKKGIITYTALLEEADDSLIIYFMVPIDDIGDATFSAFMDAKLLIRYLNWENEN